MADALDVTDSAQALADEHKINIPAAVKAGEITPTGAEGRVIQPDVQKRVDALTAIAKAEAEAARAEQEAADAEADAEAARKEAAEAEAQAEIERQEAEAERQEAEAEAARVAAEAEAKAKAKAEADAEAARKEAEEAEAQAEEARRKAADADQAQRDAKRGASPVADDGTADFTLAADAEAGTLYIGSTPRMLAHGRRLRLPADAPAVAALVDRGTLVRA